MEHVLDLLPDLEVLEELELELEPVLDWEQLDEEQINRSESINIRLG
jgi:hypothetical protein